MASTDTKITILLMLEAMDKASDIIAGIGKKLESMEAALARAGGQGRLTGDDLAAAQAKVSAAETAQQAAADELLAAQDRLRIATASLTAEKERQALADAADADATKAAADAVKAATAEQIAALDALTTSEDKLTERTALATAAQDDLAKGTEKPRISLGQVGVAAAATTAVIAGIGYESIKSAANFQQATSVLVTSGGQTQASIGGIRDAILNMSASTGTSTQQLINAMYQIGSAGIAASQQVDTLKAAAEGAKAENADLGTVANALTTIMVDYGDKIKGGPVQAMNMMISVVQQGKMTTQDLSSALSAVLPIANSAGLSFEQVGGAIATMTRQGMSAQQSTQDLAHMIGQLQKPNTQAIQLMQQMGIDSNKLSNDLGKNGLTGTMNILLQAVANNTHNGQVMLNTWYNSASASKDLQNMLASMTPSMQQVANSFLNGSITAKDFRNDLYAMPPLQRNVMNQFMTLADKANGFNQMLKSGNPDAMTFNAAMATMLGGQTSLKTALMLTADQGKDLNTIVGKVGAAAQNTGQDVNGWAVIQGNFNQKLAEAKQSIDAAAIRIGTALLPMVTTLFEWISKIINPIIQWIDHNSKLAAILLVVIGVLASLVTAFVAVMKVITLVKEAWAAFQLMTEGFEFNPIILAITAIAVAAYLIVTHWSTVKKWLEDFWNWLKRTAEEAWNFIKDHVHEVAAALAVLGGPIGMIIALALEIITHWNTVKKWFEDFWNAIKKGASDTAAFFKRIWDDVSGAFETAWNATASFFKRIWNDVIGWFKGIWGDISKPILKEWDRIKTDLESIWQSLTTIWNATGGKLVALISRNWDVIKAGVEEAWHQIFDPIKQGVEDVITFLEDKWNEIKLGFEVIWHYVTEIIKAAWSIIKGNIQFTINVIEGILKAAWDLIRGEIQTTWDYIQGTFKAVWDVIKGIVQAAIDIIVGILKAAWDIIKGVIQTAWDIITSIINSVLDRIKDLFKIFADLVTGNWSKLWTDVKGFFIDAWNNIYDFAKKMWNDIAGTIGKAVKDIFGGVINGIEDALGGIWNALVDLWNTFIRFFKDAGTWLYNAGRDIITGFLNGLKSMWNDVSGWFSDLTNAITSWKGPPSKDKVLLVQNGQLIMQSLITGFDSQMDAVKSKLGQVTATIKTSIDPSVASQTIGGASALHGAGAGTVVNFSFPNGNFAGPNSINWIMQEINKQFVQKVVPNAGIQIPRVSS